MTLADDPTNWGDSVGMSTLQTLLLFGLLPLALIIVIALLVMAPSIAHGPRYRPGLPWWAEPEWFGGPAAGLAAVDRAPASALEVGSVGSPGSHAAGLVPAEVVSAQNTGGGASARW